MIVRHAHYITPDTSLFSTCREHAVRVRECSPRHQGTLDGMLSTEPCNRLDCKIYCYILETTSGFYSRNSLPSGSITAGTIQVKGEAEYIIPLVLQVLSAVVLFVGMLCANESPRFLAMKTPDKTLTVLAQLRGLPVDHPYVMGEMEGIQPQLEEEISMVEVKAYVIWSSRHLPSSRTAVAVF